MIIIATRLGIIACRYLVKGYYENRYISAPEIAVYYNMNVRALMPALRQLTRAGILRSRTGGTTPGFIFSKDPIHFTLFQILTVLEGNVRFPCCKELIPELSCNCNESSKCAMFLLFDNVVGSFIKKMSAITIVDHARTI